MIVVTGAAGFIGSCVLAKLNERGRKDILVVDHFENSLQKLNLQNKDFIEFVDKVDFLERINTDKDLKNVEAIIHMGACSSTTCQDEEYFQKNNLEYSQSLAVWALEHQVRFIYASSAATYGDGSVGYCDDDVTVRKCEPLNLYGHSKQKFDAWVLDHRYEDKIVGLKFFNVFGPNEYHKGDMQSVIAKTYQRVVDEGKISLFKSNRSDYGDGDQKRDFVYVKDVVDVILYFVDHPQNNGIYNVGTGEARTWNDLAESLFASVNKDINIDYFEMPDILKNKYQYFTQADVSKLRQIGYDKPFLSLEDSVKDYGLYLKDHLYW